MRASAKSEAEAMEAALREDGLRITRQRAALLRVLTESEDHPDASEVHRRARALDESVSLATVYRTLAALERQGVLHRHVFEGEPARYETADAPHHDHIIDLDTGEIVEFASPEIEALQKQIAARLGYDVAFHKLELYCRKRPKTGEARPATPGSGSSSPPPDR